MSEVNQAFLRAYVKSRTAAGSQPLKTTLGDAHLRIDPAVGTNAPSQTAVPQPENPTPRSPVPSKTGVWSALGVERGVKAAVVSQQPPAVVRNATTPVPIESTQVRTRQVPAPIVTVQEKSPSLEALNQAWAKKRAPVLPELKPLAESLQTAGNAGRGTDASEPTIVAKGDGRTTRPADHPSVSQSTSENYPTAPFTQMRTDPPTVNRLAGPHSHPVPDRGSSVAKRELERETLQKLPLPVAFAPSWEVDSFLWPEVVLRLEQVDLNTFRQIGHHIANANQSGLKVLAVTSGERGVGRSTVAMHLARAAACTGLKVALVDTDAANPSLVDQLRLDLQHGWQDCLFEAVPLEEVAIHSISDSVTLFPLSEAVSLQQVQANSHRMSKLIRRISTAFDLVVLDSGRLHLDQRHLIGASSERVVDAAVVVVDTELSIKEKIDSAISILQSLGLSSIGLIENFRS